MRRSQLWEMPSSKQKPASPTSASAKPSICWVIPRCRSSPPPQLQHTDLEFSPRRHRDTEKISELFRLLLWFSLCLCDSVVKSFSPQSHRDTEKTKGEGGTIQKFSLCLCASVVRTRGQCAGVAAGGLICIAGSPSRLKVLRTPMSVMPAFALRMAFPRVGCGAFIALCTTNLSRSV